MHVLFDLRTLTRLPMATRYYLAAIVDSLLPALGEADRVTILFHRDLHFPFPRIEHPSVTYRTLKYAARGNRGHAELHALIRSDCPDVYWSGDPLIRPPAPPPGRRIRTVFAVEELLHFTHKRIFSWRERIQWRLHAAHRLLSADAIVCPSHALRVRLITHIGLRLRHRIHVIPNGVLPIFRPHSDDEILDIRRKWLVPKRYLLMVEQAGADDCLETPLKALALSYDASSITCVIVGRPELPDRLRETIRDGHLEGLVRFIDSTQLPISDLSALYSGAAVMFDPSRRADYRPAMLQAMACGTPVICAASSANKELYGNAALVVHPTDPAEWSAAFIDLMLSSTLRDRLRQRGEACARQFTWTSTAKASFALARSLAAEAL